MFAVRRFGVSDTLSRTLTTDQLHPVDGSHLPSHLRPVSWRHGSNKQAGAKLKALWSVTRWQ
jgi:hypothetical protein